MILAPKIKKSQCFLDFFRYLEEICEIPIKFDAFSAKIGAKIAKFQWFCLKFMKMSPKFATKICWIVEVGEVQRNINLVDLAKSFQTSIYLQKSASIQPRTSHLIFFNFPSLQGFNFHRPPAPHRWCWSGCVAACGGHVGVQRQFDPCERSKSPA